ncbi:MAG: potassium-transporting ATPase subunit C, partial [Actinobacteria bacterium]
MALVTLVLTGVLYPLLVTAMVAPLFPRRAAGGLVERDGHVVGARLIGQAFASERYFHPRPSAGGYDAMASGASNLGPTSERLRALVASRVAGVRAGEPGAAAGAVPVDL